VCPPLVDFDFGSYLAQCRRAPLHSWTPFDAATGLYGTKTPPPTQRSNPLLCRAFDVPDEEKNGVNDGVEDGTLDIDGPNRQGRDSC
jgi:hypothetical protein